MSEHDYDDAHARELLEHVMESDKEYKEAICANGPDDLPKRVLWMVPGDDKANMIVPAFLGAPPDIVPADEISMVAAVAQQQFGTPWLIGFLAEAYVRIYPEPEKRMVPRQRGEITKQYLRGDPNVSEAISAIVVHKRHDGTFRTISVQIPFRYADGGVVWGEATWFDSIIDGSGSTGAIADAMIAAFGGEQN